METLKVVAQTEEDKEAAQRLRKVIKSLIRTGFINLRELPKTITVREAVGVIQKITGGQCS